MSVTLHATMDKKCSGLLEMLTNMVDVNNKLQIRSDLIERISIIWLEIMSLIKSKPTLALDRTFIRLENKIQTLAELTIFSLDTPQLPYFSISMFSSLQYLTLDLCPPSTVNDLYQIHSNLRKLTITNSGIVDLSKVLAPFKRKYLEKLSPMVFPEDSQYQIPYKYLWSSLITLKLVNCGITKIDESMHFFTSIEYLDLSHNEICHVVHLQDCIDLKYIDLSYNRIRVLSNLDRVLGSVTHISFAGNEIESLDGIDKIYSLESIDLMNNNIDDFHEIDNLCRLPNLESIKCKGNPFSSEEKSYRMKVYGEFIKEGSVMSSSKHFPVLDGKAITKNEMKRFRRIMFKHASSGIDASYSHFKTEDMKSTTMNWLLYDEEEGEDEDWDEEGEDAFNQEAMLTTTTIPSSPQLKNTTNSSNPNEKLTISISLLDTSSESLYASTVVAGLDSSNSRATTATELRRRRTASNADYSNSGKSMTSFLQAKSGGDSSSSRRSSSIDMRSSSHPINDVTQQQQQSLSSKTPDGTYNLNSLYLKRLKSKAGAIKRKRRIAFISDTQRPEVYPTVNDIEEILISIRITNTTNNTITKYTTNDDESVENKDSSFPSLSKQLYDSPNSTVKLHTDDNEYMKCPEYHLTNIIDQSHIKNDSPPIISSSPPAMMCSMDDLVRSVSVCEHKAPLSSGQSFLQSLTNVVEDEYRFSLYENVANEMRNSDSSLEDEQISRSSNSFKNISNITNLAASYHNNNNNNINSTYSASISNYPKKNNALYDSSVVPKRVMVMNPKQYAASLTTPISTQQVSTLSLVINSCNSNNSNNSNSSIPEEEQKEEVISNDLSIVTDCEPVAPNNSPVGSAKYNDHINSNNNNNNNNNNQNNANLLYYVGDSDYKNLSVINNMELYFREQVFHSKRPSKNLPYMRSINNNNNNNTTQAYNSGSNDEQMFINIPIEQQSEKFITVFYERIINISSLLNTYSYQQLSPNSSNSPSRKKSFTATSSSSSNKTTSNVTLQDEERLFALEEFRYLVLTDLTLYIVTIDINTNAKFCDAPLPTVLCFHPLYTLCKCIIFFGFQRCILSFSSSDQYSMLMMEGLHKAQEQGDEEDNSNISNINNNINNNYFNTSFHSDNDILDSSFNHTNNFNSNKNIVIKGEVITYQYLIIPREKSRTYPIISRIPKVANIQRNEYHPIPLSNVKIENKDFQLIEKVMQYTTSKGDDHDIILYQMLFQIWRNKPNLKIPRTFIITKTLLLLCREHIVTNDILIDVIDTVKLSDIQKISIEENPLYFTLILKPNKLFATSRKWRLLTDSRTISSKLQEECRRICSEIGNNI